MASPTEYIKIIHFKKNNKKWQLIFFIREQSSTGGSNSNLPYELAVLALYLSL